MFAVKGSGSFLKVLNQEPCWHFAKMNELSVSTSTELQLCVRCYIRCFIKCHLIYLLIK